MEIQTEFSLITGQGETIEKANHSADLQIMHHNRSLRHSAGPTRPASLVVKARLNVICPHLQLENSGMVPGLSQCFTLWPRNFMYSNISLVSNAAEREGYASLRPLGHPINAGRHHLETSMMHRRLCRLIHVSLY
jgi:hypothetical protein